MKQAHLIPALGGDVQAAGGFGGPDLWLIRHYMEGFHSRGGTPKRFIYLSRIHLSIINHPRIFTYHKPYGGFHSRGGNPKVAGWFIMRNPTKMGWWLGVSEGDDPPSNVKKRVRTPTTWGWWALPKCLEALQCFFFFFYGGGIRVQNGF